jgi:hypothetical protein
MGCPNCGAEIPADRVQCADCGTKLARRPRRRADLDKSQTPFASGTDSRNPAALTAFRLSVFGLIPFLGLVLGPSSLVLGYLAWRKDRASPAPQHGGPALAAIVLGSLSLLTNWIGLILMLMGLGWIN